MILRPLFLLLAVALAAAMLMAACVSAWGLMFVSVATVDADVALPVPLMIPRAALHFVPDHVFEDAISPLDEERMAAAFAAAGVLADALAEVPGDVALVEVRERETFVRVGKEGDDLVVHVDDEGARVRVRTPLALLGSMADVCDPAGCDLKRLARIALREMRDLRVEVRDADNDVKLYAW